MSAERGDQESKVVLESTIAARDEIANYVNHNYYQPRRHVEIRQIAMRAAGFEDPGYEAMSVLTGWALTFGYHPQQYWISYELPEGADIVQEATGFGYDRFPPGTPANTWAAIKQSIDKGNPVEGNFWEQLVFAGYQDADEPEDRKLLRLFTWEGNSEWWSWKEFVEWTQSNWFARHTERSDAQDAKQTAAQVMRNIVTFARNDPRCTADCVPAFGLAGMEVFARDVGDTDKSPDDFDGGWIGCHAIAPQYQSRRCTSSYLEGVAELFDDEARVQVLDAVGEYQQAIAAWQEWENVLGVGSGDSDLDSLKKVWANADNRRAGAALVRKAARHEAAAVDVITSVLGVRE